MGTIANSGFPAAFATLEGEADLKWALGNDFDWLTFDFDHDMDTVDEELAARLNADTADLQEFKSHGGKLILTHGFADPQSPTLNTIAYYERLITSQTREGRHDEGERKEALRRTQEIAMATISQSSRLMTTTATTRTANGVIRSARPRRSV